MLIKNTQINTFLTICELAIKNALISIEIHYK